MLCLPAACACTSPIPPFCSPPAVLYRRLNLHRRGRLGKLEREAMEAGLVPDGAEDFLFTNADHRELVSAGAAAGLAAAFGAPIGGACAGSCGAGQAWGSTALRHTNKDNSATGQPRAGAFTRGVA